MVISYNLMELSEHHKPMIMIQELDLGIKKLLMKIKQELVNHILIFQQKS
jgi:hypothetical protein